MAKAKGSFDSIRAGLGSFASKLPFVKRSIAPTPEPFSSIEDETPLSDILLSQNAAPIGGASKEGIERPDIRSILSAILGHRSVLIGLLGSLAVIVVIVVVAVAVTIPPKAPEAPKPFTKEGEALVRTWLVPAGDPLESRVEMQRSGVSAYTSEDAAKLGLPEDRETIEALAAKNDQAIRDLYGTAP
jgi:hypothetical protein